MKEAVTKVIDPLILLRSHIHEYGHVQNRHVMFITIDYIKNRNLKNT